MTRWNISNIFFLSVSGERREVELKPGVMNIITGGLEPASRPHQSYRLLSRVEQMRIACPCTSSERGRRCQVDLGDAEMVIGRIVPPVGQATSTHMFASSGRNLPLPATVADFNGSTTLEAAKAFIERVFGIGDTGGEADASGGSSRGKATVRHVTPYLFVTKEVIYSETVLLHGLEKADKARDILATMPYFLRVNDEASAMAERRLRQLQRALDKEEFRERSRAAADALKQRALSLLAEAHRIGIAPAPSAEAGELELLAQIKTVSDTQLEANTYPTQGIRRTPFAPSRNLGSSCAARRKLQATRTAIRGSIWIRGGGDPAARKARACGASVSS